jgi:hypothetical protein
MNAYPIFEKEIEKEFKEDKQGAHLREYQDALKEFRDAVFAHLDGGMDMGDLNRWKHLARAAELAEETAKRVHEHMHFLSQD